MQALEAVIDGCRDAACTIDVMVNGNPRLAASVGKSLAERASARIRSPLRVRLWHFPVADKALAWNHYILEVWEGSEMAFFVDGNVCIVPSAFVDIAEALQRSPHSLAASGIPSVGPTAKRRAERLRHHIQIHGNLFALRGEAIRTARRVGFRLPRGIYRNDHLIGSAVSVNFQPRVELPDASRIVMVPSATWTYRVPRWWRASDVAQFARRRLRQAQGRLEDRAIGQYLGMDFDPDCSRVGRLPETSAGFVSLWRYTRPRAAHRVFLRYPLSYLAYRLQRRAALRYGDAGPPVLVTSFPNEDALSLP